MIDWRNRSGVSTTITKASSMASETTATQLDQLPGTGVEPPLIAEADSLNWNDSFDVIVVGLGAAGVSSAIEAADRGARVAFIDRFEGGGTTARSGSVMYAGGGTALQRRLGVEDTPDNMFNCLRHEVQDAVSEATLRRFCTDSPANFDFVTANGTRYSGTLFPNKTSYPVHGHSLYYSGNELIYTQDAKPAHRGHLADGIKRFTAFGPAFIGPLIKSALKKGVTPIRRTRVTRLIKNNNGEIIGVEAMQVPGGWTGLKHKVLSTLASYAQIYFAPAARGYRKKLFALEQRCAHPVRYRAGGGVVLAAGGFILNKEMTARYLPDFQRALKLGTTGDTGAGIALGVSVGGVAQRLGTATAWRFINPPQDWPKAAIVNLQGKRYVNEAMYGAVIGTRMMAENNGECILIMDKPLFESSLANLNLKSSRLVTWMQAKTAVRTAKSAATLDELAARLKIDGQQLKLTIEHYNAAARGERQDEFGKAPGDMQTITQGPFYAINMSVGKGDITSVISLGGLKVCEQTGSVLDADNQPIPGLFAAGRSAIGVASNAYVSGLSIADGVFSGRRAGQYAWQRAQGTQQPQPDATARGTAQPA
tara:strand:- start:609 stop:2387 length:1779 start_codon:yes stop_codon:yes gene_type:complete